jgi:chemotaxis protein CheY-P-specific phosphatase CheC
MSSEKARKKLEKIVELVQKRLGDEVGGLMGGTLVMSDLSTQIISKENYFDKLSGKVVFSEIELSGEIEGQGGILIGIKDAIRLGGTLIMLPENELEAVIASEEYSEEIEDSYGELANLIAGAYTSTFEEMYAKSFRFIRKNSQVITPMTVDIDSDQPLPNQNYYQVSAVMKLNNIEMGKLTLLAPAASFGIDELPQNADDIKDEVTEEVKVTQAEPSVESAITDDEVREVKTEVPVKPFDFKKQKKIVDACLAECRKRMEGEVGALLGVDVKLNGHTTRIVNKEDFFMDEASGKQILAHMDITGDLEGKSYLYVGQKDAIRIGGTLIMLPPDELENVVRDGEFGDDSEDAYGEIANIISGVYTAVFEEQYSERARFVKNNLEEIVPMKVDIESDEPMPDIMYYMATATINLSGQDLGNMQMLLPLDIFKLDGLIQKEVADDAETPAIKSKSSATGDAEVAAVNERAEGVGAREQSKLPEFLIVSNEGTECSKITTVFNDCGIAYKVLDYKENVTNYLPGDVKAVFLVMASVDEKGLGAAIKISSASTLPLIAVGPQWTRTKVIKAVKYGVDDIILTPASDDDILEKINSLQTKKAA